MKKRKIIKIGTLWNVFQESSLFLLITITLTLIITNLLFVFNITITQFHLPIIYILTSIGYIIWKRKEWKQSIVVILVASIVFVGCAYIATSTYDLRMVTRIINYR